MTEFLTTGEALYRPTGGELAALACEFGGLEPGGRLRPLAGGCHNDVYAYETPDGKLVARSPKDKTGLAALKADYELLLELDGRRMPRAVALAEVRGTPVALVEFVDGEHRDDFNALLPAEITELAGAVAEFHAEATDRYSGRSGTKPTHLGTHADYLRAMMQEGVADRLAPFSSAGGDFSCYPAAPGLFEAGLKKLELILKKHSKHFSGTEFHRLHHDLNKGNIFWKADGTVAFIDANPTYGDPCDDISYIVSDNGGSPGFQRALVAAYERAMPGIIISPERMEAYTLKNGLDDLAWTIEMCERYAGKPEYGKYRNLHVERVGALRRLLG